MHTFVRQPWLGCSFTTTAECEIYHTRKEQLCYIDLRHGASIHISALFSLFFSSSPRSPLFALFVVVVSSVVSPSPPSVTSPSFDSAIPRKSITKVDIRPAGNEAPHTKLTPHLVTNVLGNNGPRARKSRSRMGAESHRNVHDVLTFHHERAFNLPDNLRQVRIRATWEPQSETRETQRREKRRTSRM